MCEKICFSLKYLLGTMFCVFLCVHMYEQVGVKHRGNKIELFELNSNGANKPVWGSVPCCNWSILYISGNKHLWIELNNRRLVIIYVAIIY